MRVLGVGILIAAGRNAGRNWHSGHQRNMSSGSTLFMTGFGKYGQLGCGPNVKQAKVPTEVKTASPVTSVSCGKKFTVFVSEGKVFAMGSGEAAGKSDTFEPSLVEGLEGVKIKSVSAGHAHALALSEDGQVFSWGAGCHGLGDKAPRRAAEHVKGLDGHRIQSVSSGGNHAGALTEEGLLLTWGNGENGRLGHGDNTHHLEPVAIVDIDPFDSFECGDHFCAAISKGDGLLYTWGHNKVGELGHEGMSVFAQESSPLPIDKDEYFGGEKIVNVGCGHQHSVAVTEGGAVYIWGSAGFVHHTPHRFNMLSPPAWPSGSVIEKAFCGQSYSIVVTSGHSALSWGRNQWGMTASISMGEYIGTTGVLGLGDKTKGWGEVEPKEVSAIKNVSSVSAGPMHAAYIAEAA